MPLEPEALVRRAPHLLLVLFAFQGCESSPPTHSGAPDPGRLVIVGGALQAENAAVYSAVLEGRSGAGPVCVIPTASGDPQAAIEAAVETISAYGGEGAAKGVLISTATPERARDPAVAAELSECSGFYFTGGSQSRILDVFLPAGDTTVAYRALMERWRDGAVVAGTSAGAAMMSRVMISGGSSDEAVSVGVGSDPQADGVQLRPGMGFSGVMLDQHFLARGRIGRLLVATIARANVGFGIDENTAVVVDGDTALVVGASGVVIVDPRMGRLTSPMRVSDIRVFLAGSGDVIDLRSWHVSRSADKTAVPVESDELTLPADPFERWAFLDLIADMGASSAREASFELGDATLRIRKSLDFSAYHTAMDGGIRDAPLGLSAGPFRVDLVGPDGE